MLAIVSIKLCHNGFERNESFMNHLVPPLLNKMEWKKEKIVIFLIVLDPYCFNKMYQNPTREKPYSHCHAPNPGPTRLADPNRFLGRET